MCSLSRGQFAIQQVLWNSLIHHAMNTAKPSEPTLSQRYEESGRLGAGKDFNFGDLLMLRIIAEQVEGVSFLAGSRESSSEESALYRSVEDARSVDCHFDVDHCCFTYSLLPE